MSRSSLGRLFTLFANADLNSQCTMKDVNASKAQSGRNARKRTSEKDAASTSHEKKEMEQEISD